MCNLELSHYSLELLQLIVNKEALHKELIIKTADLQSFEVNLFKLCLSKFSNDVTFLEEKSKLLDKISEESYCNEVYSVLSDGAITFYDLESTPLIRLSLEDIYEEEVCYDF